MPEQRDTYRALVAALRAEFGPLALESIWIQMREHRYDTSSLGVLAQAVHDAHDVMYDTGPVGEVAIEQRPRIAVICGSTRFRAEMTVANRRLTLDGYMVLAPGVFAHDGDAMTEAQKLALDALHLRKIDQADFVYVVNPRGYIGESTSREIAYAHSCGKPVRYLVPVADQADLTFLPGGEDRG